MSNETREVTEEIMVSEADATQEGSQRSIIACHSCRKRKVKCDRAYPTCHVCEQTAQECNYPLRPKKPGPKIGSLQKHKRRNQQRRSRTIDRLEKEGDGDSRKSFSPPGNPEVGREASVDAGDSNENISFSDQLNSDAHSQLDPDTCTDWSEKRRNSKLNINSLSFILHPSHETSTPEKDPGTSTTKDTPVYEKQGIIQQACHMLGFSQDMAQFMIRVYFNNMVAINLFHEPTFTDTIANFATPIHICALLAAMAGFAAKFYIAELDAHPEMDFLRSEAPPHSPDHLLAQALAFVDEALVECDDDPPPICVIQALIVVAHCKLSRGVRGKAWRLLGTCVRLAYELNLHLVDALEVSDKDVDPVRWRDAEEKRRAWWAIWEMDVFASTVRRTPTAIDWTQMETLLPVDDADWFQNRPAPSAFLEPDPVHRWKALQESGNQSPKAWFLVINSLMKDAQIISSPRGVPYQPDQDQRRRAKHLCRNGKGPRVNPVEESRQKLSMLANSVQCFILSLPAHLKYRNQYLGFEPPVPGKLGSTRQLHCSIYNIYAMTQLARLMIHRFDMFGSHTLTKQHTNLSMPRSPGFQDADNLAARQYFEAADNILMLVSRSCEDHVQHINPFMASTIWLGAAVQLVRKYIGGNNLNQGLVKSRFDVLYLTYKRCVEFWDTKTALEQNLESLEMHLEGQQQSAESGGGDSARHSTRSGSSRDDSIDQATSRYPPWSLDASNNTRNCPSPSATRHTPTYRNRDFRIHSESSEITTTLPHLVPNSPPVTVMGENCTSQQQASPMQTSSASPLSRLDYLRMHMPVPGEGEPTMPILDFMQMSRGDRQLMMSSSPCTMQPTGVSSILNAAFFDAPPGILAADILPPDLDWRNLELPIDIHDVLSGLTTY